MTVRDTLGNTNLTAKHGSSRATGRDFDGDQQLCLRVKSADVNYSETHTDCEIWEPVGQCSVPLKQKEEKQAQQQQGQEQQEGSAGQWNDKQPKGEAAEIMFNYLGGSRGHAVGMVTDRRVKPYGLKAGRGMTYAPDGSEQMLYFKQDGTYLVSLDGKSVENPEGKEVRKLVVGHVTKKMQTHKIEESKQQGGQQQSQQKEEYKHEGDKTNTGIRFTANRIEFVADDQVVAFYDKTSKAWQFDGKTMAQNFSEKVTHSTPVMDDKVTSRHNLEDGATHNAYGNAGTGKTSEKVFVKATLPGPPTSLDTQA